MAEDRAGTLVGILVLEGEWLEQLFVEPTLTGRGIGARLLTLAKRARPDGLRLWTFASNNGAQRFCSWRAAAPSAAAPSHVLTSLRSGVVGLHWGRPVTGWRRRPR